MAGFQFNFNPEGEAKAADSDNDSAIDEMLEARLMPAYDARELVTAQELQTHQQTLLPGHELEEVQIMPGLTLLKGRVGGAEAAQLLNNTSVADSDLVPNVYEGGFKLWEGAIDLCHYLMQEYKLDPHSLLHATQLSTPLQGKKVLELGCGHGLPGILCLLAGAEVHFQDFNKEVLTTLTMPAVLANLSRLPAGRSKGPIRFFSGDWHYIGELLTSKGYGGHYDLILTSESIYNEQAQYRLIECIKQVLQPPLGIVYVAAKSHYFGVGGGIPSFERAVKRDGIFEVEHVYRTSKDVSACMVGHPPGTTTASTAASAATDKAAAAAAVQEPETAAADGSGQQSAQAAAAAAATGSSQQEHALDAATAGKGGNVREVLQLKFPSAILPFFM